MRRHAPHIRPPAAAPSSFELPSVPAGDGLTRLGGTIEKFDRLLCGNVAAGDQINSLVSPLSGTQLEILGKTFSLTRYLGWGGQGFVFAAEGEGQNLAVKFSRIFPVGGQERIATTVTHSRELTPYDRFKRELFALKRLQDHKVSCTQHLTGAAVLRLPQTGQASGIIISKLAEGRPIREAARAIPTQSAAIQLIMSTYRTVAAQIPAFLNAGVVPQDIEGDVYISNGTETGSPMLTVIDFSEARFLGIDYDSRTKAAQAIAIDILTSCLGQINELPSPASDDATALKRSLISTRQELRGATELTESRFVCAVVEALQPM